MSCVRATLGMGSSSRKGAKRSGCSIDGGAASGWRMTTVRKGLEVQIRDGEGSAHADPAARAAPNCAALCNTRRRVSVTRPSMSDLPRLHVQNDFPRDRLNTVARGRGEAEHVVDGARDRIERTAGLNARAGQPVVFDEAQD